MANKIVKCKNCGDIMKDINGICPQCGSNEKVTTIAVNEKAEAHEQIRLKVKEKGKKKPTKELILGHEKSESLNVFVNKTRVIDRANNEYTEIIKNLQTNEIIHYCKEPLTKHFGHGSAKFKKDKK